MEGRGDCFQSPLYFSEKSGILETEQIFDLEAVMFGFFKKAKSVKELDRIIAEITMNMQNNYKDAAQSAFKELEQRYNELIEAGELSEAQKSEYGVKIASFKERLKAYSHKDQKPYWTK